jgi:MFS family permease
LTASTFGSLVSVWQTLAFAPCTLIAGGITDKVNRKNLVLITSILGGLSTAGNYFAAGNQSGYTILVVMRFINSGFSAFC